MNTIDLNPSLDCVILDTLTQINEILVMLAQLYFLSGVLWTHMIGSFSACLICSCLQDISLCLYFVVWYKNMRIIEEQIFFSHFFASNPDHCQHGGMTQTDKQA